MNKQTSPLDTLVQSLAAALNPRVQAPKRRKAKRKQKRSKISRNPGTRDPITRTDNQLSLTRSQFTATSPLNYFTISTGSTPGGSRVQGRELISAVTAPAALTGAFSLLNVNGVSTQFALNPSTFPRLQSYAIIYEFFKFHKCDVMFQANQPTTAVGEILVSVDYDAKDNPPASATSMMRNISSTMANIYSDCSLQILGSLSRLPKFVCAEFTTPDIEQVDQAIIYTAAEGVTAASGASLGYLIIQYDVEFYTPN